MNESTISSQQTAQNQPLDLKAMWDRVWGNRKKYFWAIPITFVVSAILILCVPKYYECTVILAPEAQDGKSSLNSLVSSFGLDLGGSANGDAIYPTIYPDVISSPDFLISLFDVPVKTLEGDYSGTFYNYIDSKTRRPFWKIISKEVKRFLIFWRDKTPGGDPNAAPGSVNPFWLNKRQLDVISTLQEKITCNVDKKTSVIKITIQTQDPMVCAIMADAMQKQIQQFMMDYRTQKAQKDILYYQSLIAQAKEEYTAASEEYIAYMDSHNGFNLQLYKITATNLQGEMEMKYAAYTSLQKQLIAAQAKLQENTPVFTTIQSASIPDRAAGPHRSMFVLVMCFLVGCGMVFWDIRDLLNLGF